MVDRPEKPDASQVYLGIVLSLYQDIAASLELRSKSVRMDGSTLIERFETQGIDFLTKVLPTLGKSLDQALGRDVPLCVPAGFKASRKTGLPILFGELWQRVFVSPGQLRLTDEGVPPPDSVAAVKALRQLTMLLYKLEGAHSKESEAELLRSFVATDAELPEPDEDLTLTAGQKRVLDHARLLLWKVLQYVDLQDITPRHGPGAVATGERGAAKMLFRRIYASLEEKYPFVDYFFCNYGHLCDELDTLEDLEEHEYGQAKVVLVPKDSRGPRIISEEPLELQWIQQGQRRVLYRTIEQHPLTAGFVNFTDQEVNRGLALRNSINGTMVTLDMKEASDRVSLWLVRQLFPGNVLPFMEASRSQKTLLPQGFGLLTMKKFAPMGSALCFPVEALVFWALAVAAIHTRDGRWGLRHLPPVYVYGDDIVIRKEDYETVASAYEQFHLLLNAEKCCTGRFFRESCGMDAFAGHPVIPIRVRTPWQPSLSPGACASYVALYNALRRDGYTRASNFVELACADAFRQLPRVRVPGVLPLALVKPEMTTTELLQDLLDRFRTRWNSSLQRYEVKVPMLSVPSQNMEAWRADWPELIRRFIYGGPPDPLGLLAQQFDPCSYPMTRATRTRWAWTAVQPLVQ